MSLILQNVIVFYRTRTYAYGYVHFPITYVEYAYVIPEGNVRSHLGSVGKFRNAS